MVEEQRRHIISCSFGKDSIAAAIISKEMKLKNVSALYCRVMFDDRYSIELPEQEEFIFEKAIPTLKNVYGIETEIITPKETVVDRFYRERKKGKYIGEIYGWPGFRGCWVSKNIKLREINEWKKNNRDIVEVVGIAADENDRQERDTVQGKRLILCENGITEKKALIICKNAGLLSPIYSIKRQRTGCWFCPCQRTDQLKELREKYPDLWDKMLQLDRDSPFSFKPKMTVKKYEEMFKLQDEEEKFWDMLSEGRDNRRGRHQGQKGQDHKII